MLAYVLSTLCLKGGPFPAYSSFRKDANDKEGGTFRAILTKDWFTGECFYNVTYDTKARKDKNVNFGMLLTWTISYSFLLKREINLGIASRSVAVRRAL